MKTIDIENWSRKGQYRNFIGYTNPVFSVGTKVDVTELVNYCKQSRRSFFTVFLYIITKELNRIDELKMRLLDDEVVLYGTVHPSFVVLEESGALVNCITHLAPFEQFYRRNRADIAAAKHSVMPFNDSPRTDCIYISCLPWVNLTSMQNPYHYENKTQTSIPRITWGKYERCGERYEMYLDVALHHALADGYHAGLLINGVQNAIGHIEDYLEEKNDER